MKKIWFLVAFISIGTFVINLSRNTYIEREVQSNIQEESKVENIYYDETSINLETMEEEVKINYAQDEKNIESVVEDFLGVFHTYCYLDNSYTAKMISDYTTPSCLYQYLKNRVNGKSPWATEDELMAYLKDYEPNRGDYITNPKQLCYVSNSDLVVDWSGKNTDDYKVYVEYLLEEISESNEAKYTAHMASLYMQRTDNQWKVDRIRYISEGGIIDEYSIK